MDPEERSGILSEEDLQLLERTQLKMEEEDVSKHEISRSTHCSDDDRKIKRESKRERKAQTLKKSKLKLLSVGTLLLQIQRSI